MHSARWLARRIGFALPVIAIVVLLTFALIHLAPGDPVYILAGDGGSPAYYADMRERYALDQPLAEQFLRYVSAMARADFGYSFMYQQPVIRVLLDHVPASLLLGFASLALATLVGGVIGVTAASTESRGVDLVIRVAASVAFSAPVFWTGQMFMLAFAVRLGLFPVSGMTGARGSPIGVGWAADVAWHLVLPALTLALPSIAVVARLTRASVRDIWREPFVLAAVARGIGRRRILLRHVLPNAAAPVVAYLGQHVPQIVTGAALTEALFGWPGLGYLVLHASLHRDYPLVTAAFVVISATVVMCNIAADLVCAWLDPRVPPA